MKKIFLVLGLLISAFIFADNFKLETRENTHIPTSYTIKCFKCYEYAKEHPYSNGGSWAERRYECEKAGTYTMIYKCKYGHTIYINTKTGERK